MTRSSDTSVPSLRSTDSFALRCFLFTQSSNHWLAHYCNVPAYTDSKLSAKYAAATSHWSS